MKPLIRKKHNVFDLGSTREIKSTNNVFGNFLVNEGLYDKIEITEDNIFELADLADGDVRIDCYCPKCKARRVFSGEKIPCYDYDEYNDKITCYSLGDEIGLRQRSLQRFKPNSSGSPQEPWIWTDKSIEEDTRLMIFKFVCAMDGTHHMDFVVSTCGNQMIKIGQYPTYADLLLPELREYKKVMSKEDERELKRANGLYASGIGVGSFVYLRRIFERIIVTASKTAIKDGKFKQEDFDSAHVDEKVKMLKDYFPKTFVNNTVFYGIISKGIHELSEDECIEFYPIMQAFIIMVFRQLEKIRRDEEEEKNIAVSLGKIAAKVK